MTELTKRVFAEISTDEMLLSLLGTQALVDMWWNSQNANFKFEKPIDCDKQAVRNYIESQWK